MGSKDHRPVPLNLGSAEFSFILAQTIEFEVFHYSGEVLRDYVHFFHYIGPDFTIWHLRVRQLVRGSSMKRGQKHRRNLFAAGLRSSLFGKKVILE